MTLSHFDRERDALSARHPGWRVWFVPNTYRGAVWCAQREPTLNCGSPEELDRAITEVEAGT